MRFQKLIFFLPLVLLCTNAFEISSSLINRSRNHKTRSTYTTVGASRGFGKQQQPSNDKTKKKKQKDNLDDKKAYFSNSFQEAASKDPEETKRILELYGGDIQQGTIRRVNEARVALEQSHPLLGEAMKLKEEATRWNSYVNGLGVLQRADLNPELFEVDRRRIRRLEQLAQVRNIILM